MSEEITKEQLGVSEEPRTKEQLGDVYGKWSSTAWQRIADGKCFWWRAGMSARDEQDKIRAVPRLFARDGTHADVEPGWGNRHGEWRHVP